MPFHMSCECHVINLVTCQVICHVCHVMSCIKCHVMSHVKSCYMPYHLTCHSVSCYVTYHILSNGKMSHVVSYHMSHVKSWHTSHVIQCIFMLCHFVAQRRWEKCKKYTISMRWTTLKSNFVGLDLAWEVSGRMRYHLQFKWFLNKEGWNS